MAVIHTPPSTYILRELHDVSVPESVSWVPQTIGWKILAAVVILGIAYTAYRVAKHWWDNRYRREALAVLDALPEGDEVSPQKVFKVLKVVLRYLNSNNANLFGTNFLDRLDSYLAKPKFVKPKRTNDQPAKAKSEKQFSADHLLDDVLAQTWMQSLESRSVHLDEQQKQTLIQYARYWVINHHAQEKGL
ncbi:DUF4381 domain-containing protein [Vibrio makurazakiensis]|uniref:DUF4381 domain-containing protein n=1 Tax=Vibrio makurazakiensis TaxID=2910250 RepID=UPI003D151872